MPETNDIDTPENTEAIAARLVGQAEDLKAADTPIKEVSRLISEAIAQAELNRPCPPDDRRTLLPHLMQILWDAGFNNSRELEGCALQWFEAEGGLSARLVSLAKDLKASDKPFNETYEIISDAVSHAHENAESLTDKKRFPIPLAEDVLIHGGFDEKDVVKHSFLSTFHESLWEITNYLISNWGLERACKSLLATGCVQEGELAEVLVTEEGVDPQEATALIMKLSPNGSRAVHALLERNLISHTRAAELLSAPASPFREAVESMEAAGMPDIDIVLSFVEKNWLAANLWKNLRTVWEKERVENARDELTFWAARQALALNQRII